MRSTGLPFVSLLLPALVAAAIYDPGSDFGPGDCRPKHGYNPFDDEACTRPVEGVVAVATNLSYLTTIACSNCPYVERNASDVPRVVKGDYELFLNVTLSHDNRTLLLNDKPIYPKLETIPNPPAILARQLRHGFSYSNLSEALSCPIPSCRGDIPEGCRAWCDDMPLGTTWLDYLYTAHSTKYEGDKTVADARYWEIVFDPLGGTSGFESFPQWEFDDPDRKSLRIVVAGTQVRTGRSKGKKNPQAPSDLFGPADDGDNKVYEYQIVEVETIKQQHSLASKQLTLWAQVRRFFGMDIWKEDGYLVYLREEWGAYGKKGTLRNMFGEFVHWDEWRIIGIWSGIVLGSALGLWLVYKLVTLIMLQRELARWDGMDAVWTRIRNARPEDEEDALLDDGYRDEPDEGPSAGPSRYTDEPRAKPLPSKPLPEKPLPAVPLIDA